MKRGMVFALLFVACTVGAVAKDYKAAVYQLPVSDSFVNLFKAIGDVTNNTFSVDVIPPARGQYLIENKQVDVIFPATMSNDPKKNAAQTFDYSTARVYSMIFILYANKSKPLDVAELKKGNPKGYKIETTGSLGRLFEFTTLQTTDIPGSLKKVDAGAIDGLIYTQDSADPPLKQLALKNVSRKLYSSNDITFGIQKGALGGELDKVLTDGIAKLKADGRLAKIIADSIKNSVYSDWQP